MVVPGETDQVITVGWEVRDGAALRAVVRALEAADIGVERLSPEEADSRRAEEVVAFTDPAGTPVEVFHGPVLDHSPVVTPYGARFVTGAQGLGHVVLPVTDPGAPSPSIPRCSGSGLRAPFGFPRRRNSVPCGCASWGSTNVITVSRCAPRRMAAHPGWCM